MKKCDYFVGENAKVDNDNKINSGWGQQKNPKICTAIYCILFTHALNCQGSDYPLFNISYTRP